MRNLLKRLKNDPFLHLLAKCLKFARIIRRSAVLATVLNSPVTRSLHLALYSSYCRSFRETPFSSAIGRNSEAKGEGVSRF